MSERKVERLKYSDRVTVIVETTHYKDDGNIDCRSFQRVKNFFCGDIEVDGEETEWMLCETDGELQHAVVNVNGAVLHRGYPSECINFLTNNPDLLKN